METRWFENAQLKARPDVRPWILTRCASAGIQRYHMAVWTGDTHSDYPTLKAHVPEMLNSGLSGLTWWTSDSGGFLSGFYKNDQYGAHARLYERWMQLSTFSPITRAHHAGPVLPYEFGPECEAGCRHYLQLRYRLLPYIYACAWEASKTGAPMARPLVLEFPGDPGSVDSSGDEYLFGPNMLIAPVVDEDMTSRPVYFPPGKWFDWDTGKEYVGPKTISVDAPQHRIPVAVRAGAIVPMAPLMQNTSAKPWDPITLEVYPSGTSTFTMYRDDGRTFAYRHGSYTVTRVDCNEAPTKVTLAIDESNKLFAPRAYVVRLHLANKPRSVSLNGVLEGESMWSWDAQSNTVTIKVVSGSKCRHSVRVAMVGK